MLKHPPRGKLPSSAKTAIRHCANAMCRQPPGNTAGQYASGYGDGVSYGVTVALDAAYPDWSLGAVDIMLRYIQRYGCKRIQAAHARHVTEREARTRITQGHGPGRIVVAGITPVSEYPIREWSGGVDLRGTHRMAGALHLTAEGTIAAIGYHYRYEEKIGSGGHRWVHVQAGMPEHLGIFPAEKYDAAVTAIEAFDRAH